MLGNFYISLFFSRRFYWRLVAVAFLFIFSYWLGFLFNIALLSFFFLVFVVLLDVIILFSRKTCVIARRELSERFSNSDLNSVGLHISNHYPFPVRITHCFSRRPFRASCSDRHVDAPAFYLDTARHLRRPGDIRPARIVSRSGNSCRRACNLA